MPNRSIDIARATREGDARSFQAADRPTAEAALTLRWNTETVASHEVDTACHRYAQRLGQHGRF